MATYLKCKIQSNTSSYKIMDEVFQGSASRIVEEENIILTKNYFEIEFNGHTYQKNLLFLEFEVLFNRMGKYWRCIENLILTKNVSVNNISNIKEVTTLLLFLHNDLQTRKNEIVTDALKYIDLFKKSICKLAEMDNDLLNTLTSVLIIAQEEPMSQYFHSYIEVFHLILSIESLHKIEHVEKTYESIMLDLIKLSYILYEKDKRKVLSLQPFPCLCVRNQWISIIQNIPHHTFWVYFNNCITKENEEFCSWLLKHISWLQYYVTVENCPLKEEDINIRLVNEILELTVSKKPDEINLLNILRLLSSLLTELWIKYIQLDPYQILWDYFYKHLNSDFRNIELPNNIEDFMQIVDNISKLDSNTSSYNLFLHLLHKHLSQNPFQWRKLQGRIYSRIPVQKIKELGIIEIYNISLLFFTVASLNEALGKEILEKLSTILESLSSEQQQLDLVWLLHVNMIITHIRQSHDIRTVVKNLNILVKNGSENRENFHLIKHFVDGLGVIFNTSNNLDLGQHCLLSSWITPYISTCSHSDLCTFLKLLINILKKAVALGKWNNLQPIYLQFVLPALKDISVTNSVPKIGELAGLIMLNISGVNINLISYFCSNTVNVDITHAFLCTVLINSPLGSIAINQESMLISAWCRICLLCSNTIDKELYKKIFDLQSVKSVIVIDEEASDEPFVNFVKVLSRQMSIQTKIFRLKELCELCFGNIDHWIPSYLTSTTSESQVLHLFTRISLLFYYCTPLLYQKSKSFCLLSRLVPILLLPKDVLMGKLPILNVMHAIEKTWHLFVKGINKLDYLSDPYIDRTLKDLIVRYLPHFPTKNSPIMNILDNDEITKYVLEKITNSFLLHSARSSEENTYKALKLIENILQTSVDLFRVQLVIQKVFMGVFEVIMFNLQKSMALNIIEFLTSSEWYQNTHTDIQLIIKNITQKHLAFNTTYYFQLIDILLKHLSEDICSCLPFIKEQIIRVERMRGVGFDNTLRQALSRIENRI